MLRGCGERMGVTYEINQAQQRVYTRCAGEVRLAEVLEHFEVLSADPDCPDWLDVMLDLSDMKTLPTSAELNRVSTEIARVLPAVRSGMRHHRDVGGALRHGADVRGVLGEVLHRHPGVSDR